MTHTHTHTVYWLQKLTMGKTKQKKWLNEIWFRLGFTLNILNSCHLVAIEIEIKANIVSVDGMRLSPTNNTPSNSNKGFFYLYAKKKTKSVIQTNREKKSQGQNAWITLSNEVSSLWLSLCRPIQVSI